MDWTLILHLLMIYFLSLSTPMPPTGNDGEGGLLLFLSVFPCGEAVGGTDGELSFSLPYFS